MNINKYMKTKNDFGENLGENLITQKGKTHSTLLNPPIEAFTYKYADRSISICLTNTFIFFLRNK